jgi:hypothetical protein
MSELCHRPLRGFNQLPGTLCRNGSLNQEHLSSLRKIYSRREKRSVDGMHSNCVGSCLFVGVCSGCHSDERAAAHNLFRGEKAWFTPSYDKNKVKFTARTLFSQGAAKEKAA